MGPQRLNSSPYGRAPTPTAVKVPGHDSWIHYSWVKSWHETSHESTWHESSGRKQKRTLNTPVSPWEISDTYSGLQLSAILMNTPQIWFLGIRFLRIALKSQHSLTEIVLQNRQQMIDLLIPEQGGTWAILAMWIWNWLMPLLVFAMPYWCCLCLLHVLSIVYPVLSLTRSASYNMQSQFNKDINLQPTMENITHP